MNPYHYEYDDMYQPRGRGAFGRGRPPSTGGRRPRGSRGGRGRTDKQSRDDIRRDAHRTKVNETYAPKIEEKINNLLCGGLERIIKQSKPSAQSFGSQAIVLPLTTRQIGFSIAKTEAVIASSMRPVEEIDFHAVYRASLMQLDIKLHNVRRNACLAPSSNVFRDTDLALEYLTIGETIHENINPISNLLNSIGNFEYKGDRFTVREPLIHVVDGVPIPTSTTVTIHNLREFVLFLSDQNSPQPVRQAFYDTNSIPGSIWVNVENNEPVLANPDMIIPDNYDEQNVRDDFTELKRMIDLLRRKKPELVTDSIIDMQSGGNPCLLLSNSVVGQAISNRILAFGPNGEVRMDSPCNTHSPVRGSILTAWSPRELSVENWYGGSLLLAGEIPQDPLRTIAYSIRADLLASQVGRIDSMAAYTRAY